MTFVAIDKLLYNFIVLKAIPELITLMVVSIDEIVMNFYGLFSTIFKIRTLSPIDEEL